MNSLSDPQAGFAGLVRRTAAPALVATALAFFAGCESTESHVVSAPPPPNPVVAQPVVVQQQQQTPMAVATTPNGGTILVTQAPPALQQEVPQARPSSSHVWIPGYWTWRNSRYEWMAGHWEVPPRTSATWVAPRWERLDDGSYRFYEGYWQ